jgi:predicted DCC family thiol-disulfide oxidoreductase YuxK
LFFDGDCAFCHASVRRVARWDKRGRVCFAPLQGETARKLGLDVKPIRNKLKAYGIN